VTHPFTVIAVDDERIFLNSLELVLKSLGYNFETYDSIKSARKGLSNRKDLFIVILDHDFKYVGNELETGYDLSKWIKTDHWAGKVLPIIYLTGRENADNFISARQEFGGLAPDDFINKDRLAVDPSLLGNRLNFFETRLWNFEATAEEHGQEIALGAFGSWWL
jgi:CheY-like chemotaxis protein